MNSVTFSQAANIIPRFRWLVIVAFLAPQYSTAAGNTCIRTKHYASGWGGGEVFYYKVNTSTQLRPNISVDELRATTAIAADTWNSQANGPGLVYSGTTLREDIPITGCGSRDFEGIVVVRDRSPGDYIAVAQPRCFGFEKAQSFRIIIYRRDHLGSTIPWDVGLPYRGATDLQTLLTHEFGHTLNLGDMYKEPGPPWPGTVMWRVIDGEIRARNLFRYDMECLEIGPKIFPRQTRLLGRRQIAEQLGDPTVLGENWLTKGTGSESTVPGIDWAVAYGAVGCTAHGGFRYDYDALNTIPGQETCSTTGYAVPVGPRLVRMPEFADSSQRVFHSSIEEYPDPDANPWPAQSNHRVAIAESNNGFNTMSQRTLQVCTDPSYYLGGCMAQEDVHTARRLSAAYHPGTGKTLLAWTHQKRGSSEQNLGDGIIRVSPGFLDDPLLVPDEELPYWSKGPDAGGVLGPPQSTVSVGIACSEDPLNWHCLLAFVPTRSGNGEVWIYPFNLYNYGGHFIFEWGSQIFEQNYPLTLKGVPVTTYSDLELWRHAGKWYIAALGLSEGSPLQVLRSISGKFEDWEMVVELPGAYLGGPSAVSTQMSGDNLLIYGAP